MTKKAAGGSGSAHGATVTVEPTPGVEQTPPPSMAPGSEWAENVDKPKVHRSPPKEKIYPKWKPGDPHPTAVAK